MEVRKSNGTAELFDQEKIKSAILEASKSSGQQISEHDLDNLVKGIYIYDQIKTSEIERQVSEELMSFNKKIAKEYLTKAADNRVLKKNDDFIKNYISASNAATGSKYDSNANVNNKNIVTLGQEIHKGENIQQNRYIMHNKIKNLYSKKLADQYLYDLSHHIIYRHDESGTPGFPYCVAITMYPFLTDGLTKLGGVSIAPTDLKSFCGEFINLVYSISSQFMGACMYKDQKILIREEGISKFITAKELVEKYLNEVHSFENYQGTWDYSDIKEKNLEIYEDGKFVKVNKVYRRKYSDKIYTIKTKDKHSAQVTKDHIFKQILQGRCLDIKAEQLLQEDTLVMNKDFSDSVDFGSKDYKHGWLIGMICGDGCITKENIVELSINHQQEFLGDIFNEYSKEIFNITLNKNEGHKCYNYSKYNKDFYDVITNEIIGLNTYTKHIDIKDKSLDYLCGFLDGLFCADGSYSNSHGISITLSNYDISRNIHDICKLLGIYTLIREAKGKGNRKDSYGQYISNRVLKYLLNIHKKCIVKGDSLEENTFKEIYYYGKNALQGRINSNKRMLCTSNAGFQYNSDVIDSIEIMDNDDKYVYEVETETHWYNCGGFITHNCATPEFLMYMDYFIRKDYGENYLDRLSEVVDGTTKQRTLEKVIENYFQQIVHSMNMPAGNRGYQTVFWNIGYFDRPYFEGVFGDFAFPDGTKPVWKTLSWLQKKFMKWFNKERTRYVLTFPVETMAMLTDGKNDLIDKEYADFTAEMWAEGHSFFCYLSDSPDSLSSCCFTKDQKILWKSSTKGVNLTTLEELHNTKWEEDKKNLRVFHNGSWVKGKSIMLPNRKIYKVTTENNKELYMTDNHINVTISGEKTTSLLTTDDYLMFNTLPLQAVPEYDEHLTYEQGFVIGAFLGDGSFGSEINGTIYDINFSQNKDKYEKTEELINIANKQLGDDGTTVLNKVYNNVYPLRISSKKLATFIMKWTNWRRGVYAHNKELNLDCLLQSIEFRKGILDGWYNTDGGNSNRCYTTSYKLIECMEALITSLGMQSTINVSDRTDEAVIIRDEEYKRNYPLYCIRWYSLTNNRKNSDVNNSWIKHNNSIYFKIKSIEEVEYTDNVFCIECADKNEPYFTLPNGIITHNCRLRNSLRELDATDEEHNHTTHQFSMGTASVATGSKCVMTIDLNRAIQDATFRFYEDNKIDYTRGSKLREDINRRDVYGYIRAYLSELTERVHKYLTSFNAIVKDFFVANMLPVYSAGFIDMRKQYLTVGVNGLTDAAEFMNLDITPNEEYNEFVDVILESINIQNKKDKTKDCMFNTEFIPGENVSFKHYNWDKADGYFVSDRHNMYSSYFYNPEDTSLSILDKFKLHGRNYVKYLDGGSALHMNLQEHLSKDQYRQLLRVAVNNGTNYFTFNVKNTCCEDCGYISKDTLEECPHCHSKNLSYLTRIIGYLKKTRDFGEPRQIEAANRYYDEGKDIKE